MAKKKSTEQKCKDRLQKYLDKGGSLNGMVTDLRIKGHKHTRESIMPWLEGKKSMSFRLWTPIEEWLNKKESV